MARNTIILKGDPLFKEGTVKTGQTIKPGMFVKRDSGGVLVAAAGDPGKEVALELGIEGSGIDDDYAAGDHILTGFFRQGDEVYAILATSQTIVKGAVLSTAAGGHVKAAGSDAVVAKAVEAVTTTAAVARIKIEIV
jgi:hypothetical protein